MSNEKELQKKELESVNGGATPYDPCISCKSCGKRFVTASAEHRVVGSGCDKHTECKCPHCGTWNLETWR